MKTPRPPFKIFPYVRDFCGSIVSNREPFYILVTSDSTDVLLDCINNVDKRIQANGGERVLGWKIWEIPGLMIEAEFHATWKNPHGKLFDVTPNETKVNKVLFLPDTNLVYMEKQINNIRKPLNNDPRVLEFIDAHDAYFNFLNLGERATSHQLHLTQDELQQLDGIKFRIVEASHQMNNVVPGRNNLCLCGSGKKYKKCSPKHEQGSFV